MTGKPPRQRETDVVEAIRRLAGLASGKGFQKAILVITSALDGGVPVPKSTVLALGHRALDPNAQLDRDTRIRAATALSALHEPKSEAAAIQMICHDDTPLDAVQAAAAILLGTPGRRLSATTVRALTRYIRRYGQMRGPMVVNPESFNFARSQRSAPCPIPPNAKDPVSLRDLLASPTGSTGLGPLTPWGAIVELLPEISICEVA